MELYYNINGELSIATFDYRRASIYTGKRKRKKSSAEYNTTLMYIIMIPTLVAIKCNKITSKKNINSHGLKISQTPRAEIPGRKGRNCSASRPFFREPPQSQLTNPFFLAENAWSPMTYQKCYNHPQMVLLGCWVVGLALGITIFSYIFLVPHSIPHFVSLNLSPNNIPV